MNNNLIFFLIKKTGTHYKLNLFKILTLKIIKRKLGQEGFIDMKCLGFGVGRC